MVPTDNNSDTKAKDGKVNVNPGQQEKLQVS